MKKFIVVIGLIISLSIQGLSTPTNAYALDNNININEENTNEQIQDKINELFEKENTTELKKEFKFNTSSYNNERVTTSIDIIYKQSGELIVTNHDTGKGYYCVPDKSYVGYGYKNGIGEVGCLQGLYLILGAGIDVDGLFGPQTYNATLTFQRYNSHHLSVDGIAGPKTFNWAIFLIFSEDGWA